jgi:hypothetical protein
MQKVFDPVTWTKLLHILRETGIDWHIKRLVGKLYVGQTVKVQLDQGEARIGKGVRQGCSLSPIIFNSYSEYLTTEAVEGDVGLEIRG